MTTAIDADDQAGAASMRSLGLLGGMSWESTAIYYRLLNQGVRSRRGGLHSAPLLLCSLDFAPIAALQARHEWDELAARLGNAGRSLADAGAGALLICSNTMHRLHDEIAEASGVPILHIADATGAALRVGGCRRPILLATRFTMEGDFYARRLHDMFAIQTIVPDETARRDIHRIIYEELCRGVVSPDSRRLLQRIVAAHQRAGADSVILGCTEITMLLAAGDVDLPVFDTTALHASAGVSWLAPAPAP